MVVRRAPDFLRPIDRLAGVVEEGLHLDDHGRCLRLIDEFLLAPPAHADRLARHLHGDNGGVGRGIVGAVVAVAARPLHVVHGDLGCVDAEGFGERAAQREHPLAVGPHREMAIAVFRQATGRRDRGMREMPRE